MIVYHGKVILNPCHLCYRREVDTESGILDCCWECYVATILRS